MRRLKTVKFRWNFAFLFLFRVIRIVSTSSQRVSSDLLFGNEMICQTPAVPATISLNNSTVNQCQWYTGCMPLEFLIDLRLIKFCNKLSNSNNFLIKSIYSIKGKDVLKELENKYEISHNSRLSWRTAIWRQFELSIDFHG